MQLTPHLKGSTQMSQKGCFPVAILEALHCPLSHQLKTEKKPWYYSYQTRCFTKKKKKKNFLPGLIAQILGTQTCETQES